MATQRRILSQHAVTALVIGAVFLGTLAATFMLPPEDVRLVSEDGLVRVEGKSAFGNLADIRVLDGEHNEAPVLGAQYQVLAAGEPISTPFSITFTYDPRRLDLKETSPLAVMAYDARVLAWRYFPSVQDASAKTLTAEIVGSNTLYAWSYGYRRELSPLKQEAVLLDELLSFPPEGAVGYTVATSIGSDESSLVLLKEERDRGGCAGVYRVGTSETLTSKEVEEDGLMERVMVFWQIGNGCAEGESVHTSLE